MVQAKLPGHGPLQAALTHRSEWIIKEAQTGELWKDPKAHPVPTTAVGSAFHFPHFPLEQVAPTWPATFPGMGQPQLLLTAVGKL